MIDGQLPATSETITSYCLSEIHMLDGTVTTGADLIAAEADVCIQRLGDSWHEIHLDGWGREYHEWPGLECDLLAWSGR